MSEWKKLNSDEWGAPFQGAGPLGGIEQRDSSVTAILERDEIKQIQGLDIHNDITGSIDDTVAALEEGDEQAGDAKAAKEAKANQR